MARAGRPHYDKYADLARALMRKAKSGNIPCWICGHAIDFTADWRSPNSYTYDHVVPIALGGSPRGAGRPAHRGCNSRRGANVAYVAPPKPTTTRDW